MLLLSGFIEFDIDVIELRLRLLASTATRATDFFLLISSIKKPTDISSSILTGKISFSPSRRQNMVLCG